MHSAKSVREKPPIRLIPFAQNWVVHEDEFLLVVNKPAGLLSVPGRNADPAASLVGQLQTYCPETLIVHRLDMDTSGLMVLAKTPDIHRQLSRQFEMRQTKKQYQAICFGKPSQLSGDVIQPMRCDWENRPLQMVDFTHGKFAHTLWQVQQQLDGCFKVLLTPITGRSHQLRLHMKQLGHPILGDNLYADLPTQQASNRLCLHACQLSFIHPATKDSLSFSSTAEFWLQSDFHLHGIKSALTLNNSSHSLDLYGRNVR